ncbi:hypothetical protein HAX54_030702 [Datura stramonium]|uniref:RRM domain-containing protein n=1 Tax=Datura stramonium TaxID=4076 RepID=A0ABS8SBA4_DATST|nr:hypothetical protein [Datura stramonium]
MKLPKVVCLGRESGLRWSSSTGMKLSLAKLWMMGFLQEDDDYEDLYNDVNVGENFLQSFRKNEEAEKAVELVSPLPESGSAAVLAAVGEVKGEKEENIRDLCCWCAAESCDPSGKVADLEKNASNNVVEIIQRPTAAGAGVLGNADAELEVELSKYGAVKEVKFFDEKASGKSKGYCQAEFHEPAAATACKEGMNGHVFNGRACVVAFASPYTVKRMGEAQVNRNQQNASRVRLAPGNAQARRGPGDSW